MRDDTQHGNKFIEFTKQYVACYQFLYQQIQQQALQQQQQLIYQQNQQQ